MIKSKLFKTTAILLLLVFTAGCNQHLGNFSALATGNFRAENIDSSHLVAKNVKGGASTVYFLGIPLGGVAKVDQAVSEGLSKNNGDIMTNARLYAYWWTLIIFGGAGYTVEGDVQHLQIAPA